MSTVDSSRRLLMVPEVADRLRVSVKTVRRLIETGEVPAVRLGAKRHAIRVDERELEAWLDESRVTAPERTGTSTTRDEAVEPGAARGAGGAGG
jgi:excisionase family DNA binding protein